MRTKFMILFFLAVFSLTAACTGEKETGSAVNPTNAAPAATPLANINYTTGIYDEEKGPNGSWRWVSEQGIIKLKNNPSDMRLKIVGSAPVDLIGQTTEVTVKLNGELLEKFTLTKDKNTVEKEFTIPASKQTNGELSELTLSCSKSFVPKQVYKNSNDDRKLSFSLTKLEWEAK